MLTHFNISLYDSEPPKDNLIQNCPPCIVTPFSCVFDYDEKLGILISIAMFPIELHKGGYLSDEKLIKKSHKYKTLVPVSILETFPFSNVTFRDYYEFILQILRSGKIIGRYDDSQVTLQFPIATILSVKHNHDLVIQKTEFPVHNQLHIENFRKK